MDISDEKTETADGKKAERPSTFAYWFKDWFKAAFGAILGATAGVISLILALSFVSGGVRAVAQTLSRALGAP